MEIRTLKYFLAVAREQNMTEAANLLFVTQPTLSRQMADLEKELGKKLFIRSNRSTTLTEEGMHLRQRPKKSWPWWNRRKARSRMKIWT
ncbi:LysR family transcriptional regulator [Acidaminococcus timonensis]|uniref:LysR family transcriptional regulator n=1 Tax=Acidaminococcus timonensis TaxID=1871002 RepID=UPI0026F29E26|nr:LysR family transcriptional regulator [Acidaminococcus timonensis]